MPRLSHFADRSTRRPPAGIVDWPDARKPVEFPAAPVVSFISAFQLPHGPQAKRTRHMVRK
jgi:hypothetical protein